MHALPDPHFQADFYEHVPVKRLGASLADSVVIVVLCALVVPLTAFTGLFFFPLLYLTVGFVYRWVTIARGSATWGMRLMAIELRGLDGGRLDRSAAFAHTLAYSLTMAFVMPQVISIALMLTDDRGRGLADRLAGTVAINRPATF
ncbi:MAG: RDD family protein [Rhodobacterales bacterium]|nr:RDD family protein [Rhodobacterales bacterium]